MLAPIGYLTYDPAEGQIITPLAGRARRLEMNTVAVFLYLFVFLGVVMGHPRAPLRRGCPFLGVQSASART